MKLMKVYRQCVNSPKYHTMDCGDYYITVYEDDEEVNRPN